MKTLGVSIKVVRSAKHGKAVALILALVLFVSLAVVGCAAPTREISDFDGFFEKMLALGQAESIMTWDMETGGMPDGAIDSRANAIAIISSELFDMGTSDEMREFFTAVEAAEKRGEADEINLAVYRIAKSDFDRLNAIPADEYRAFSELTSIAVIKWAEAKEANDYSIFAPYMQQIIDYNRNYADYLIKAGLYSGNPYNAMLADYEPGLTVEMLDEFFGELRSAIVPFLQKIVSSDKQIRSDFLYRGVPIEIQKDVAEWMMGTLGFDMNRGALGESAHPFTNSISHDDVRITTHYDENKYVPSFFAVMHESGHAIYEQNIAEELVGTILDSGVSMGMHESQSRFYENMIGRSRAFWEGMYDDFLAVTDGHFDDISLDEMYEAVNIVEPTMIRLQADELTYSLHIMVRYEIEKAILNDPELTAYDLPEMWNEKMQEYLGLTPSSYAEGILQDIHWAYGEFGYFPTYAIGNAYAAQIRAAMRKEFDVDAAARALDFGTINGWLTDKIHRYGSLFEPSELLLRATGEEFSASHYVDYLIHKYSEIYGI